MLITAVFLALRSVSWVFRVDTFSSFSLGMYFGSAVSVAMSCAK